MANTSKFSKVILIILLGAGIVTVLGGSYVGLFSLSGNQNPSNTPVTTPTTKPTSTATSSDQTPNIIATVYAGYTSPDSKLTLEYPFTWPKGADITGYESVLKPLNKYQAQLMFSMKDDKSILNISLNKYILPKDLSLRQLSDEIYKSLSDNGWNPKQNNSYTDGPNMAVDLNLSKNSQNYRAQYKIVYVSASGDSRTAYLIMGMSLERNWVETLLDYTHLLNSTKIK